LTVSSETGLEEVPEGYRWKIRKNYFMRGVWTLVILQKKVGPFWVRVAAGDSRYDERITSNSVANKYFNRAQRKLEKKDRLKSAKSKYGVYPPKKFGEAQK
jgi:hypothetical protein